MCLLRLTERLDQRRARGRLNPVGGNPGPEAERLTGHREVEERGDLQRPGAGFIRAAGNVFRRHRMKHGARFRHKFHRAARGLSESGPGLIQHRQHFMPDQIPEKRRIVVTLIIHPGELPGLRPGFNPGSRNIEPGPGKKQSVFAELPHSGHAGESIDPGPTHPLKEESFKPVILVMRGEDDIKFQLTRGRRESPVAFFSGRRLKPLSLPVHADLVRRERNAAGVAERPAGGFPGVGIF